MKYSHSSEKFGRPPKCVEKDSQETKNWRLGHSSTEYQKISEEGFNILQPVVGFVVMS